MKIETELNAIHRLVAGAGGKIISQIARRRFNTTTTKGVIKTLETALVRLRDLVGDG